MGTVKELFEQTRSGSLDVNTAQFRRVFQVEDVVRDYAATEPGIPSVGSAYRFGNRWLRADRVDVEGTPAPNVSRVTVSYSSDGRGRLPPRVDDTDPKFKTISMAFVRDERKIPAFRKRPIKTTKFVQPVGGGPEAPEEIIDEIWEPFDFSVEMYYSQFTSRVNVPKFSASDAAKIAGQQGKVHVFGTLPTGSYAGIRPGLGINVPTNKMLWKFIGANVEQQSGDGQFTLTYTWISDPGNGPFSFILSASDFKILAPTGRRYAFEAYYVTPQSTDPGGPGNPDFPEIDAAPVFDFGSASDGSIGDGYKLLPGLPEVL